MEGYVGVFLNALDLLQFLREKILVVATRANASAGPTTVDAKAVLSRIP